MPGATKVSSDALEFRDDGTVYIRWDEHEVTLGRPKHKVWGSILEQMEAADKWVTEVKRTTKDLGVEDTPYRGLYARIIEDLGGVTISRSDLPVWMSNGSLMAKLNEHWLTLPLGLSG